jgi:hypothetical protein
MNTVTGSVTVGPDEVTTSGAAMPSGWLEGVLEHDLRKSNWMTPWTLSTTDIGADRINDVRSVIFVKVLTIPTHGKYRLGSNTIWALDVEVEVVLNDTAGLKIGIDVTSKGRNAVCRFTHGVTGEHPETLGKWANRLDWRIPLKEVIEPVESRERDERTVIVHPVKLWHPVVGLVDSNRGRGT